MASVSKFSSCSEDLDATGTAFSMVPTPQKQVEFSTRPTMPSWMFVHEVARFTGQSLCLSKWQIKAEQSAVCHPYAEPHFES